MLNVWARDLGMDVNMASFVSKCTAKQKGHQQADHDVGADQLAGMQGEPRRWRGFAEKVNLSYNQAW